MKREELAKLLKEKILFVDGAMGTILMQKGVSSICNDLLNIEKPDVIKSIHKGYADAGADIITTNTFGANRLKLSPHGYGDRTIEINKAAVENARQAAPKCLIAGELGPLGKYVEPLGDLTFDDAYNIYSEQTKGLKEADLIIISTISDIKKLKAAIIAAKDNCNLPIIASMTFQDGRTSTGTDPETFCTIADSLGVDAIGINCSEGPEGLLNVAKQLVENTNKPICIQPNAGLPKIIDGKTIFSQTPEDFSLYAEKFYSLGISILGGCCGTTPDHIKTIFKKLKGKKPISRKIQEKTKLCSRLKTVGIEGKTLVVGERINPTGKKRFQEELKLRKTDYIRQQALEQVALGAALLDVNVGVVGINEKETLPKAIEIVQSLVDAPIVIDSSDHEALELALKKSDGKPLINSVNGKKNSLAQILPLAKKYGAAIIALALDDSGIPSTKEKRVEIAKKIITEAENKGLRKRDIIVDCLVLTIATNPENEKIILKSVKEIKKLGHKTILGISNISHGLPNRSEINSKFLTKASKTGLDLAIINPEDNIIHENTEIEVFKFKKISKEDYINLPIDKKLYNAILYGDEDNIMGLVQEGLKELKAMKINNILVDALNEVGEKFNNKEYFLPHVLASAKAMKKAFSRLKQKLIKEGGKEKGIILFATVENDVHDIGKNIVIALLESHNYKIIDMGTSVPKEKIVEAVKKHNPDLVGLSALMTTTALEMEKVIKELRKNNIKTPVIIGGAVVTEEFSEQIRAEYSKDALSAIKEINEIILKK
ncbi:5-methyltetrahydrofolate--homocysteine methyltransferase [Candidatus Woesearchaeota archaeon]|nr:5-methyltetrahydrofolate--homocysteine methyltransferase [Candidatus Woesearchaeota archaeon]|tara:strand:+ start:2340 stop:4658 length:2319 start_codon:yes stop_codon:yes gene_type:complete